MFIDCTFCILLNCGIHCVQSSFNSFVWLHCVCPCMFVCMLTCRPWTFVRLCSVSVTHLLKHHRPFLLQAMASICLMMADHRPVAIHCDICSVDALCFRCYNCGGMCCRHCVFQHRRGDWWLGRVLWLVARLDFVTGEWIFIVIGSKFKLNGSENSCQIHSLHCL